MDHTPTPLPRTPLPPIPFDLDRLIRLGPSQRRRLYIEVFGQPGVVSNADHLLRKLAWELQARIEGRLPDAVRERALLIARHSVLRSRPVLPSSKAGQATTEPAASIDPRLPRAGSCLVRCFRDRQIVVQVLTSGFEFEGRHFASLSAIAREVTGTRWNGFLFFGLHLVPQKATHARKNR